MSIRTLPISSFLVQESGQDYGQYLGLDLRGFQLDDRGDLLKVTIGPPETIHFRCGNVTSANLINATPDTPAAASMAFFGQLNIPTTRRIAVVHLHLIENGSSGSLAVEVYRRRAGSFTKIASLSLTNTDGDFATDASVPTGDLALLEPGDYLYCQPTAKDLVTNGANGLTVDVHFEVSP